MRNKLWGVGLLFFIVAVALWVEAIDWSQDIPQPSDVLSGVPVNQSEVPPSSSRRSEVQARVPLGTLHVSVLDEVLRSPIVGATVVARFPDGYVRRATASAPDGAVSYSGLPDGAVLRLQVRAPGYEALKTEVTLSTVAQTVVVALTGTALIHGVMTSSGKRIAGVDVALLYDEDVHVVTSDANGQYRFEHVAAGRRYTLVFAKRGYRRTERHLVAKGISRIDVDLERVGSIFVTLHAIPVSRVESSVALNARLHAGIRIAYDGLVRFEQRVGTLIIDDLPAVEELEALLFLPAGGVVSAKAPIAKQNGKRTATFAFNTIRWGSFRILSAEGEPLRFKQIRMRGNGRAVPLSTDSNGSVAIPIDAETSRQASIVFWTEDGVSAPVLLRPRSTGVVPVRLGDYGGRIHIRSVAESSGSLDARGSRGESLLPRRRTKLGLIFLVPEGSYSVLVSKVRTPSGPYVVAVGTDVYVDLDAESRGNARGETRPRTEVVVYRIEDARKTRFRKIVSDDKGLFVLEGLLAGEYAAVARLRDDCRITRRFSVRGGQASEIGVLDDQGSRTISVRFHDEAGQPLVGEHVSWHERVSSPSERVLARTDYEGVLRLGGISEGGIDLVTSFGRIVLRPRPDADHYQVAVPRNCKRTVVAVDVLVGSTRRLVQFVPQRDSLCFWKVKRVGNNLLALAGRPIHGTVVAYTPVGRQPLVVDMSSKPPRLRLPRQVWITIPPRARKKDLRARATAISGADVREIRWPLPLRKPRDGRARLCLPHGCAALVETLDKAWKTQVNGR